MHGQLWRFLVNVDFERHTAEPATLKPAIVNHRCIMVTFVNRGCENCGMIEISLSFARVSREKKFFTLLKIVVNLYNFSWTQHGRGFENAIVQ